MKALGSDANNRDRAAIHGNRLPNDVWVRGKMTLPVTVVQNHDRIGSGSFSFARKNEAPGSRLDTQGGKEISAYVVREDPIGLAIHSHAVHTELVGKESGKDVAGLAAEVAIVRDGEDGKRGSILPLRRKHRDLVRVGDWERAEQKRIHDAEDGGIGTDAKRDSDNGNRSEAGTLA